MKTLFHGNDKGSALLSVLLLLFVITLILFALSAYIHSYVNLTKKEKEQSLIELQEYNTQTEQIYDAY